MRNLKGDFRGIPRLRFAPLGMTGGRSSRDAGLAGARPSNRGSD